MSSQTSIWLTSRSIRFLSFIVAVAWLGSLAGAAGASPPTPPAGEMGNGADPNYVASEPELQALAHKAALVEQHMAQRSDGLNLGVVPQPFGRRVAEGHCCPSAP
jgi:hypothetical protein